MKPKQLALLLIYMIFAVYGFTQTPEKNYPVVDGHVYAMAQKGDTLYIGGEFSKLGYKISNLARFKNGDSLPDLNFSKLDGQASVAGLEPDGNGGYFLAFSGCSCCNQPFVIEYGGVKYKTALLHLFSDFSVDTTFAPLRLAGGCIFTIKRQGQRLYLAGSFTTVNNSARQALAALNVSTGRLLAWTPQNALTDIRQIETNASMVITLTYEGRYRAHSAASGVVLDILSVDGGASTILADDDKLYVGGNFENVIQNARGIAAFAGDSLHLRPDLLLSNYARINSIAGDDSGGYYIGGYFSLGPEHQNLAHILSNGLIDTNFKVTVGSEVLCLAKYKNTLYAGGTFTLINNESRGHGAAFNLLTGALTDFDPRADSYIHSIEPVGDTIYLGGDFVMLGNRSRRFAGAILPGNEIAPWNPQPDQPVFKILSNKNNNSLFIAGEFVTVKDKDLPYIAKVDPVSGKAYTNWKPAPDYPVYTMIQNGSNLYIGGAFTKIGRNRRTSLAALDTTTSTLTAFAPNPDGGVQAMSVANNQLYIAGYFNNVSGQVRPHVAGIDLSTNELTSFSQNFDDGTMGAIYFKDSLLVVGGGFSGIRQAQRRNFAVIGLNTNQVDSYDTKNDFSYSSIQKIYRYKNDLFIAGNFNYMGAKNLIGLSVDSPSVTHTFSVYPEADYYKNIRQLSIYDNKLFVNGGFSQMSYTQSGSFYGDRLGIAVYNLETSQLTPDTYGVNGSADNLVMNKNGDIIFAGYFDMVKTSLRKNLAAMNMNTGYVTNWHPSISTDGWVSTLAVRDSSVYVGGPFNHIYDGINYSSPSLACINTNTGLVKNWNYAMDGYVSTMAIQDSTLYIAGDFHNINNTQRFYAAAISLGSNGGLTNWNPNPDIFVSAIAPHGKEIYLGGVFTKINNVEQPYLAKVNDTDGSLLRWKPAPDSYVRSLHISGNALYVGGSFTAIKTKARNSLAAFDITTGSLLPFNARIQYIDVWHSDAVNTLLVHGDQLYVGSNYIGKVKGKKTGNLFSIDTNSVSTSAFRPQPNGYVSTLLFAGNKLFTGGTWDSTGGEGRPNFAVYVIDSLSAKRSVLQTATTSAFHLNEDENKDVSVFPNPVTHNAFVSLKSMDALATVTLTDISGRIVWQSGKLKTAVLTVPMENLSSGIYLLVVENNGKRDTYKLVKQ